MVYLWRDDHCNTTSNGQRRIHRLCAGSVVCSDNVTIEMLAWQDKVFLARHESLARKIHAFVTINDLLAEKMFLRINDNLASEGIRDNQ